MNCTAGNGTAKTITFIVDISDVAWDVKDEECDDEDDEDDEDEDENLDLPPTEISGARIELDADENEDLPDGYLKDRISEWLSNTYGFCHDDGFSYEIVSRS